MNSRQDPTPRTARPEPTAQPSGSFPSELLIWLSPAFPVGSFAYSQGLETAIEAGFIGNEPTLQIGLQCAVLAKVSEPGL
ncbi:MAG: hypothetical protein AAFZ01_10880 [Pseudomonadota bacterium]